MEIIPAIDISEGKCVRLYKGKKGTEVVYYKNPVDALQFWIDAGAIRLHVVDLDGAWGSDQNKNLLKKMINQATDKVKLQIGGGIRSVKAAKEIVQLGADRVVIGTLAVKNPQAIEELANNMGSERLVIALDYKFGKVSTHGWTEQTNLDPFIYGKLMEEKGAGYILFSSVESDGAFTGPDLQNVEKMVKSVGIPVYAAGGVRNEQDILDLEKIGVHGVVVGKAFYENKLSCSIIRKF